MAKWHPTIGSDGSYNAHLHECKLEYVLQESIWQSSSPGLCRRGAGWDVIPPKEK